MSTSGNWHMPTLSGDSAQFVKLGLMESILRSLQTKQNETLERLKDRRKKAKKGRTEIILHN